MIARSSKVRQSERLAPLVLSGGTWEQVNPSRSPSDPGIVARTFDPTYRDSLDKSRDKWRDANPGKPVPWGLRD